MVNIPLMVNVSVAEFGPDVCDGIIYPEIDEMVYPSIGSVFPVTVFWTSGMMSLPAILIRVEDR